ncbi:hypothetical protein Vi05172_g13081 [Venturia inaequalis]|nr:hypothetical protein Vi05172_g13081 [Venturia inaequalis]
MVEDRDDIGVELKSFTERQEVDAALGELEGVLGVPMLRDESNDLGEVVARNVLLVASDTKAKVTKRALQDPPGDGAPPIEFRKTKKKAKKKDTIDDLFRGLF